VGYCSTHVVHYDYNERCHRCEAEGRHQDLLNAAEENVAAMRDSDYRRANPGEYACPHCKYVSLKNEASRCPLCHGEIGADYWNAIRDRERADAEKKAAERKRAAEAAALAKLSQPKPDPRIVELDERMVEVKRQIQEVEQQNEELRQSRAEGFLRRLLHFLTRKPRRNWNYGRLVDLSKKRERLASQIERIKRQRMTG
jgi:RNA polymerase subunit RPABC4/transcription elongation factor Spt4